MLKYLNVPGVRLTRLSSLFGSAFKPNGSRLFASVLIGKLIAENQRMNVKRLAVTSTLLLALVVGPEMAQGQVFDPGPSDPALFTTVINLPPDPDIGNRESIDAGTQLNVDDGGSVGFDFAANSGSEVNISGGTVGSNFTSLSGSEVNISGGILSSFTANDGGIVTFSGGFVNGRFTANAGSQVSISGGSLGALDAMPGSVVELFGDEFRLNGDAFTGQTITLAKDDIFTGILPMGGSFIFAAVEFDFLIFKFDGDNLSGVGLNVAGIPVLDTTGVVDIDSPFESRGLPGKSAGLTLNVVDGGSLLSNFAAVDITLNVQGGTLGSDIESARSVVNISEGTVGNRFRAYSGSQVNISGGTVGDGTFNSGLALGAGPDSEVNISGGLVTGVEASSGSVVNISGGTVDIGLVGFISVFSLVAQSGSEVNISGGTVTGAGFHANEGSEVNIRGAQFILNGELLDALVVGGSLTITEPIETLEGILADGSPFSFGQGGGSELGIPNFSPDAIVTVTRSLILGDVSGDGVVNFQDISPFISLLSAGGFQEEADIDGNGVVNFLDIGPFIRILTE